MYINKGDVDFFEHGRLVDSEHSDTEFQILYCEPYSDTENLYMFGDVTVDITDMENERYEVQVFADLPKKRIDEMTEEERIDYALAMIEYHGLENFSPYMPYMDYRHATREDICDVLKTRLIACDNLKVVW